MDVSGQEFWSVIPTIFQDVQKAVFVAFDTELSGIPTRQFNRGPEQDGLPTLEARYAETKRAAEKFHILQLGLTFALENPDTPGSFVLKSYNFFLNPVPQDRIWVEREYTFHSGAIKFLRDQRFNLDLPLVRGVPYLSRAEEASSRRSWETYTRSKDFSVDTILRANDQPSLAFMQQVKEDINAWLDDKTPNKPDYLNIAPAGFASDFSARGLSSFQRRLVHQLTQRDYPDLKTTTKQGDFVQITVRDDGKERDAQAGKNEAYERRLATAVGLRWPIEALARGGLASISSKIIQAPVQDLERTRKFFEVVRETLKDKKTTLVGHNAFMDLMYLYTCFFGPLPSTLADFSKEVSRLFPNIIDTKYMATHNSLNASLEKSSLEELYNQLECIKSPAISLHPDHARYAVVRSLHEAGYDSMLTATVLIRLSAKLRSEGQRIDRASLQSSDDEVYLTPLEAEVGETRDNMEKDKAQAPKSTNLQSGRSSSAQAPVDCEHKPATSSSLHQTQKHAAKVSATSMVASPPRTSPKREVLRRPNIASQTSSPSKSPTRMEIRSTPHIINRDEDEIQARIDRITGYTSLNLGTSSCVSRLMVSCSPGRDTEGDEDLIDLSTPTNPTLLVQLPSSGGVVVTKDEDVTFPTDVPSKDNDERIEAKEEDEAEEKEEEMNAGNHFTRAEGQDKGLAMPAFDSHFWTVYGNKLRVNGTMEGICKLKNWCWER